MPELQRLRHFREIISRLRRDVPSKPEERLLSLSEEETRVGETLERIVRPFKGMLGPYAVKESAARSGMICEVAATFFPRNFQDATIAHS